MSDHPFLEIVLPLPVSVNASNRIAKGKKGKSTIKKSRDYKLWWNLAETAYRRIFQNDDVMFHGRICVEYIFIWHEKDRGKNSSDISNREKALSDFLEKKFYKNDNQIDEQHHYRRIVKDGESRVMVRVYEIEDRRYNTPQHLFYPIKPE